MQLLARIALPLAVSTLILSGGLSPAPARADVLMLGVSGEGGGYVTDPESGLGGAALRLGVRVPGFVLYVQAHGLIGALAGGPRSGTAQGVLWNTLMIGTELGPLHLAVGPSLDFIWGCGDEQDEDGCDTGEPQLGFDGRLAVHLGQVALSVDAHPTWTGERFLVGVVGGLGWELF